MTLSNYIDNGISILALVVSYGAYRKSKETALKEIELSVKANELSVKANELSQKDNLLAQADIEFQIASNIRETENRVSDIGIELAKNFDNEKVKNMIAQVSKQAMESNLNAYEEACAKYLDGKVDKERFKKNYHKQIRRLIEDSEPLMKYFDKPSSAYKCILKVYNEWYNLEQ